VAVRTTPWLKHINLTDGECTPLQLAPGEPFVTAHVTTAEGTFDEHVTQEDGRWVAVSRAGTRPLEHGASLDTGAGLFVFMAWPEARHDELEVALATDAHAAQVYLDWVEEQADPFAAAVRAPTAGAPWWLEGLAREETSWTLRDGLVCELRLGPLPREELLPTLHRLCHVRALLALERLVVDPRSLASPRGDWGSAVGWSMWADCRWPRSLRTLQLGPWSLFARRPDAQQVAELQRKLATRSPDLRLLT
jgi:hypothetical protein